jgi:chaperone required for assembly of F1-ATPase
VESDVYFVLCIPKDDALRFGLGDSACYRCRETEEIRETHAVDIVPITEWIEQESMQTCRPSAENIDFTFYSAATQYFSHPNEIH